MPVPQVENILPVAPDVPLMPTIHELIALVFLWNYSVGK